MSPIIRGSDLVGDENNQYRVPYMTAVRAKGGAVIFVGGYPPEDVASAALSVMEEGNAVDSSKFKSVVLSQEQSL